jgi:hypothetical protein
MKSTHRLILVAVVAASALAPAGAAFAGWRGIADTYLVKARTWTSDGFDTAERNGYLSKSEKKSLLGQGGDLTSGALSQNALAGSSGKSGLPSGMAKKLSSKVPKAVQ